MQREAPRKIKHISNVRRILWHRLVMQVNLACKVIHDRAGSRIEGVLLLINFSHELVSKLIVFVHHFIAINVVSNKLTHYTLLLYGSSSTYLSIQHVMFGSFIM